MDMSLDPQALGSLFEMSRDAVLGIREEEILFLNPAASALLGAVPGEKAAKFIPDYILTDPADRFLTSIKLYGLSCQAAVTRSGDLTLVSITAPQEDSPVPAHFSRALRDLSGTLLSARLAIDILVNKTDAESDPKLRGYTAALYRNYYQMKRQCEHITMATAMAHGTLPFSPKPVRLDQLFGEVCDTTKYFTSEMGISLEYSVSQGVYQTMADPNLLTLMLLNLLSNSLAHSAEGSVLRIGLSRIGNRFILSVNDQGTGIAAGKLPHLYNNPSNEERIDSVGLGLTIARGIAEQHDGALILESREGVGTKLRITLPEKLPKELVFHEPSVPYQANGMDSYLTEFSVILDKKFYNKTMFD